MPRSDLQWDVSVRLQQLIRQSGQGKWCNKGEGHLTLCKLDVKRLPRGQRTGKVVGVFFFYTPDCEMLSVFCFVFNLRYLFLLKSLESISDAHAISKCLIYQKQNKTSVFANLFQYIRPSDPYNSWQTLWKAKCYLRIILRLADSDALHRYILYTSISVLNFIFSGKAFDFWLNGWFYACFVVRLHAWQSTIEIPATSN